MSEIPTLGGYPEALVFAREAVKDFLSNTPLSELRAMTVPHFMVDFHPEIRAIQEYGPESRHYVVSDRLALSISVLAHTDPDWFKVLTTVCSANIFNGAPIPEHFRGIVHLILIGEVPPPKRQGRKAGNGFVLRMLLRQLALDLQLLFDIDLARNDGTLGGSACDIVTIVAAEHGHHVAYNTVRDWCQNPKYEDFRNKADALFSGVIDKYLNSIGVLKPRV